MAFVAAQLSKVAQLGPFNTLWHYGTADAAATVDTTGYFNSAASQLKFGDIIMRTTYDAAPPNQASVSTYGFHIVLTNTGTVVNVTDALAGTMTDTD